jgi:hypothetical protein
LYASDIIYVLAIGSGKLALARLLARLVNDRRQAPWTKGFAISTVLWTVAATLVVSIRTGNFSV